MFNFHSMAINLNGVLFKHQISKTTSIYE